MMFSVDSMSKGRVSSELTEPANKHLYILEAVRGTIANQDMATRVECSQNLIAFRMFFRRPVIMSLAGRRFGMFGW